jgi:hypothetical protein
MPATPADIFVFAVNIEMPRIKGAAFCFFGKRPGQRTGWFVGAMFATGLLAGKTV